MTTQPDLLKVIEAFLTKHQMEPTSFGKAALNDPNFVTDLRGGREVRRRTEERVRQWMADRDSQEKAA